MTNAEIATAAVRLLNANPTASMADIAAAANISRATLHRHFSSREELIRHLGGLSLRSWEQALDDAAIDAAASSGDAETLRQAFAGLCEYLAHDAEKYGFTLTEPSLESDPHIEPQAKRLVERERRFYTACQAAGVIRADLPPAWVSDAIFGLLVGLREALRYGEVAVADIPRLLRLTITEGIVTPTCQKGQS